MALAKVYKSQRKCFPLLVVWLTGGVSQTLLRGGAWAVTGQESFKYRTYLSVRTLMLEEKEKKNIFPNENP